MNVFKHKSPLNLHYGLAMLLAILLLCLMPESVAAQGDPPPVTPPIPYQQDIQFEHITAEVEVKEQALEAGADAFVSKGDPPEKLLEALKSMQNNPDEQLRVDRFAAQRDLNNPLNSIKENKS